MPQSIPQHSKTSPFTSTPATDNHAMDAGVSTPVEEIPTARRGKKLRGQLGESGISGPSVEAAREFLTVKEIAADMRVGLSSVTRLVKLGRIGALNISTGRRPTYRVPRAAYDEFKRIRTLAAPVSPRVLSARTPRLPPGIELFV